MLATLIIIGFIIYTFYAINYNKIKDKYHGIYMILIATVWAFALGNVLYEVAFIK